MAQGTKQVKVVSAAQPVPGQDFETTAFFDENGDPIDIGGGSSEPTEVTIGDVDGLEDRLAAVEAFESRIAALESAAGGE